MYLDLVVQYTFTRPTGRSWASLYFRSGLALGSFAPTDPSHATSLSSSWRVFCFLGHPVGQVHGLADVVGQIEQLEAAALVMPDQLPVASSNDAIRCSAEHVMGIVPIAIHQRSEDEHNCLFFHEIVDGYFESKSDFLNSNHSWVKNIASLYFTQLAVRYV